MKFKELTNPPDIEVIGNNKKKNISSESKIRRLKTAKLGEGLDNSEIDSERDDV